MGKKKDKMFKKGNTKRSEMLRLISNKINKKGKIKGKDKKETKQFRALCAHHVITKKGKIKNKLVTYNKTNAICKLCNAIVPVTLMSPEEVEKTLETGRIMYDQSKYVAVKMGMRPETVDIICNGAVYWYKMKKIFPRICEIVNKTNALNHHKNKPNDNNRDKVFGQWRIRNSQ